jgi:hypothetical protein
VAKRTIRLPLGQSLHDTEPATILALPTSHRVLYHARANMRWTSIEALTNESDYHSAAPKSDHLPTSLYYNKNKMNTYTI